MSYDDPFEGLDPAQRIRKLYEDAREAFSTVHKAMDEERAFCWDLEQYQHDTGNTRNRMRVQPRDQSPFRLARFKTAMILKSPPYFRARPIDSVTDPVTAKWAKWAIEYEMTNPRNRFNRVIRDVVWSGLTSRMGVMGIDWNPDSGIFGEIEYRFVDPKRVFWAQGYNDPHDPQCPWMMEVVDMPLEQVRRMRGWKNTADLQCDDSESGRASGGQQQANLSGMYTFTTSGHANVQEMKTRRTVRIVKLWERFSDKKTTRPTNVRVLSEQERYMAVAAGPHEGQRVQVDYGDAAMPESDILPDGTLIKRIDAILTEEERLAYPNGKLTICAVYSGEGVILYDNTWPQRMRSFPYLVWQPYASPFKQVGPSDVDLNWTMTLVKNGTLRRWYEQLHESRGIVMLPKQGLEDAYGEPFMYTDANGIQAIYDSGMPPQGVQIIKGPEPSPSLERFYNTIEANLGRNEGTGDVSASGDAQQLKGVAVGAIERASATGNTSVDDHVSTWQDELSLALSIVHDIQRARWSEARWVRYLGPQGMDAYMKLKGADIPAADIVISAKPTLDQFSGDKMRGIAQFADLAMKNPALAMIFGREMNLDPEDMKEVFAGMPGPMGGAPGPSGQIGPGIPPPQGSPGMPPGGMVPGPGGPGQPGMIPAGMQ